MFHDMRTGIKTFFDGQTSHAFYVATGGNIAYHKAPSSFGTSYAVFSLFGFSPYNTFDADIEEGACHFNCYAPTAELADDMANACRTMFDNEQVAVSGYNQAHFSREMQNPAIKVGPDEDDLWLSAIEFNVRIQL